MQEQTYNRTSFEAAHNDRNAPVDFQPGLRVGMQAPDFVLYALDGQKVPLSEFRGNRPLVMEFGCITAPVFNGDIRAMHKIYQRFKGEVQFLFIYAREAHPGLNYQAHTSLEQKIKHARDLMQLEEVEIPVLVDSLEGDAHQAYGGSMPSPVFMVASDGRLVYKAGWLHPPALERAVEGMLEWESLDRQGPRLTRLVYTESLVAARTDYSQHERVFERAGQGAREDVTRVFGFDPVERARKG